MPAPPERESRWRDDEIRIDWWRCPAQGRWPMRITHLATGVSVYEESTDPNDPPRRQKQRLLARLEDALRGSTR